MKESKNSQLDGLVGVSAMFLHPANHDRVLPRRRAADEALQVTRVDHCKYDDVQYLSRWSKHWQVFEWGGRTVPHPLRVALVLRVASVLELLASDILQLHIQTRFCKRQAHFHASDTHCNYTRRHSSRRRSKHHTTALLCSTSMYKNNIAVRAGTTTETQQ